MLKLTARYLYALHQTVHVHLIHILIQSWGSVLPSKVPPPPHPSDVNFLYRIREIGYGENGF